MRQQFRKQLNNSGASLILVIVAMLFVGIIAAIVLLVTSANVDTASTHAKSTGNFYSAENVIDEVKMTLEEYADTAARKAYTKWLQEYTLATSVKDQKDLFASLFATEFEAVLNDSFMDKAFKLKPDGSGTYEAVLDELVVNQAGVKWVGDGTNVKPIIEEIKDKDGNIQGIRIKGIGIEYTDAAGFVSAITTDFDFGIKVPDISLKSAQSTNLECADYAIIADEQINNKASDEGIVITGNVYGGGCNDSNAADIKYEQPGFLFSGSTTDVTIKGDYVVTRSILQATDNAELNITGVVEDTGLVGASYAQVWAKNILLNGASTLTNPVQMKVRGQCYISDDLTLDTETSHFSLEGSNSALYAYTTNNGSKGLKDADGKELRTGSPEGSSAIVVNGRNSVLDLHQAENLWIAGKAFVSVPDYFGTPYSNNTYFQEGESVSYRALQSAYMLPGDCIIGVGHNPLTLEEYSRLTSDPTNCYIDLSQSRKNGGVRLEDYVVTSYSSGDIRYQNAFRTAFVYYSFSDKNAGRNKMVYLYLNFQSSDKATAYFKEYSDLKGDLLVSRMKEFGTAGRIMLPNISKITNTGNVISYDEEGGVQKLRLYTPSTTAYNDAEVENKEIGLTMKYNGLTSSLNPKAIGVGVSQLLSENLIDFECSSMTDLDLTAAGTGAADTGIDLNDVKCPGYKLYAGKDITVTGNSKGIIVAKGDVVIKAGAEFTGLIIAKGKVTFDGTNSKVTHSKAEVEYLIQNNDLVKPLFKMVATSTTAEGADGIVASDLINIDYNNWKKD